MRAWFLNVVETVRPLETWGNMAEADPQLVYCPTQTGGHQTLIQVMEKLDCPERRPVAGERSDPRPVGLIVLDADSADFVPLRARRRVGHALLLAGAILASSLAWLYNRGRE